MFFWQEVAIEGENNTKAEKIQMKKQSIFKIKVLQGENIPEDYK